MDQEGRSPWPRYGQSQTNNGSSNTNGYGRSVAFPRGEVDQGWARSSSQGHWCLHSGAKKSDGKPVSIFRLGKKGAKAERVEAGQRCFQRIRTLRHPYILSFVDGTEMEMELILVTEHVVPLRSYLETKYSSAEGWSDSHRDAEIAWGTYCISSALKFLHDDCKLAHCNVNWDTVFVNDVGDWHLGGMDLLGPKESFTSILFSLGSIQPFQFQSPERRSPGMTQLLAKECPSHAEDMWALGGVIKEAYNRNIPTHVAKYTNILQHETAKRRPTAIQMLRSALLKSSRVQQRIFVTEQWHVQPIDKKMEWLRKWCSECKGPAADDPLAEKIGVVLGHDLKQAISRTTSATVDKTSGGSMPLPTAAEPPNIRAVVSFALPPLLDISKRWPANIRASRIGPLLVSLLLLNDRGVRVLLLSQVEVISPALDAATINKSLFEPLCAGFSDPAPQLRELTLKSMAAFLDHLSESNMNDRLVRHLTRLQSDPEDSIRTNVIILLAKMAGRLKPSTKEKVLLPAFAHGIKDRFPAARLSGLRAISTSSSHFTPQEVCIKFLPYVIPCLMDPTISVREAAFSCIDSYMTKLRDVSQEMKLKEEEAAAAASIDAASGGGQNVGNLNDRMGTGMDPKSTANSNTWGAWALSKISDQLTNTTIGGNSAVRGGLSPNSPPSASSANSVNMSRNTSLKSLGSVATTPEFDHCPPSSSSFNAMSGLDDTKEPPEFHLSEENGWGDDKFLLSHAMEEKHTTEVSNFNNNRAARHQSNKSHPRPTTRPSEKTSPLLSSAMEPSPSLANKGRMKLKGSIKKVDANQSIGDGWDDF